MKKYLFLIAIMSLNSCSSNVKGNWTCPTPEGGKGNCISIKEADFTKLSTNSKPDFDYSKSEQEIKINLIAPKLSHLKKIQQTKDSKDKCVIGDFTQENKFRSTEKVGKIWFAPYIDSQGYHHMDSVIYVVDEEPKWIVQK